MKTIFNGLLWLLVAFIVSYLLVAFIYGSFNPTTWSESDKVCVGIVSFIAFIFGIIEPYINKIYF